MTFIPTDPSGNPAFHINRLSRLLTRFFDARLSSLGVNVSYLSVLGALYQSPSKTQKELVALGQIGQSSMAQMLERMVKDGHLLREPDAVDRRKVLFSLTPRAASLMPEVQNIIAKDNRMVLADLTGEEVEHFLGLIARIEKTTTTALNAIQEEVPGS